MPVVTHEVTSAYQQGVTRIDVLCPERTDPARTVPVVYVLPVEAGDENYYGSGLREIAKLADRARAIFAAPTFSHLPWYADHPSAPGIRQEAHLLKVVLPFVEAHYPVGREAVDRLLLGFSKSGWGAYSLLLRHPDLFARAAAWDAPVMMDHPEYESQPIFATQENFARYRISTLVAQQAGALRSGKRLILTGYSSFRSHHQQLHDLLGDLKIPHDYRDGPSRPHFWHGGWLGEAVQLLLDADA